MTSDHIVFVGCILVYAAWLATQSPPVAALLSSHPTKAITFTTVFGAVIGAVLATAQHGVIQGWWCPINLSTAARRYPVTTRFSRLAGENSLIEASASG
jgi:hypothetical protein